ncbi:MAG: L-rhamnose mutarotase [Clostridia bacterium]
MMRFAGDERSIDEGWVEELFHMDLDDETLFGYYETEDDEYAVKVQEESEVVKRWNVYMEDMIATRTLPDGSKEPIKDFVDCVFLHT